MRKTLIILWIIIISGGAFIAFDAFRGEKTVEAPILRESPTEDDIEVESLPEQSQKSYSEYINTGDQYFENELYLSAAENYLAASKLNPNSSKVLLKLGQAYLKSNHPDKAKTVMIQAQQINPSSLEIKIALVQSLIDLTEFEQAKAALLELPQDDPEVQYYSGIIAIIYKNFPAAKGIFGGLAELESNKTESQDNQIIQNSKKFTEKFAKYETFLEADQLFLQTMLAYTLSQVGQYHAAIPLCFDIIQNDTTYRDAWIVLGYSYLQTDQIKSAIDALSQAEALDKQKPETLFYLGLAYFADNNIDNAIYYLEKAADTGYSQTEQIELRLGDLYSLKEEYEKAAENYEKVISKNTSSIDVYVRLVWLNIDKLRNTEKALEIASESIAQHPEDPMSYNLKGWALTALGEFDEAEEFLKTALENDSRFAAAYLNLGWLYEKKEAINLAKEYYKRAYVLGKGNSISNRAALRFNHLTENDLQQYYQVDISAPNSN